MIIFAQIFESRKLIFIYLLCPEFQINQMFFPIIT
jgi:hypothetical protein